MKQLILFVLVFLAFFSCQNGGEKKVDLTEEEKDTTAILPEKAQLIAGNVEVPIGEGDHEPLRFTYEYFDTSYQTKGQKKINAIILELLSTDKKKKSIVKEVNEELFKEHLTYFRDEFETYKEEDENEMTWYLELSISIDTAYSSILQLIFAETGFAGGAHGWEGFKTTLVDNKSGKVLKLKDFVGDVDQFDRFALKYFLKQNDIESEDQLEELGYWFEDGFKCTENFYFSDKGMVFVYNQYEIAPYVMGIPTFEIPFKDLQKKLVYELDEK